VGALVKEIMKKTVSIAGVSSLFAISLFVSPSIIFAAEANANNEKALQITVTANRKAQTIDQVLAPVTVITREDIEKYQAKDIADLLKRTPGVSVASTGGIGANASIFLRGSNSGHVLVLIDGVKVGSPTLGITAFQYLDLAQVERIEIVRGSRSSLYGSEAIGGVIQIFTRKGQSKAFKPSLSVSGGTQGTFKGSASLSGSTDHSWMNIGVASHKTQGVDALLLEKPFGSAAYVGNTESDKDSFRQESASFRLGTRTDSGVTAELIGNRSVGAANYDGLFLNESDFDEQMVTGKLSVPLSDKTDFNAQYGEFRETTRNYLNGTFQNEYKTVSDQLNLSLNSRLTSSSEVQVGLDKQEDKVAGTINYNESSRKNTGIYANYRGSFGRNQVDLAIRQDDNEQFGRHTTGSVAYGHEFENGNRVTLSHGRAFKAPTFNQLYFPNYGNQNLRPETSKSTEISFAGLHHDVDWSVSAFQNDISDLIAVFPVENIDKARIRGIEVATATQAFGWDVSTNLTLQNPEQVSGVNNGMKLRRRAQKIFNLNVDKTFGKTQLGASLHAEGKRYEDVANTEKMAGFATVDLRAAYQVDKHWQLAAHVNNLFDQDYETAKGYEQLGINGLLTLTYSPK
jgi:vitamin B12 transporter